MRLASFDISSTPEDQYQTFGARTDVLALRMTLSQLSQQDLIGYDTATAQRTTQPNQFLLNSLKVFIF